MTQTPLTKRQSPPGLMLESLGGSSIIAQQLLDKLRYGSEEDEAALLDEFWSVQGKFEEHIDGHAELATYIEAQLAGLEAMQNYYVELYQREIDRLTRWRDRLDETILSLNQRGLLANEITGTARTIRITYNPPSCKIVDAKQVPPQFARVKQIVDYDKAAIKKAWSQGKVVPGVEVFRKPKVRYDIAPQTTTAMREAASSSTQRTPTKKRKKST